MKGSDCMRQLYKQVCVDEKEMRFYSACDISGKRIYSIKVPLVCRNKKLISSLKRGSIGGLRQMVYNHAFAKATQDLARYLNQCRGCGKWVCDELYDLETMKCNICNKEEGGH